MRRYSDGGELGPEILMDLQILSPPECENIIFHMPVFLSTCLNEQMHGCMYISLASERFDLWIGEWIY
jgi:hypothetical protein